VQINLIAHDRIEGLPFAGFMNGPTLQNGTFTMTGLVPGAYTVVARVGAPLAGVNGGAPAQPIDPAALALYAVADITIDSGDATTALTLRAGASVSGRVAFDATTLKPPSDLTKVRLTLTAIITGNGAALGVPPGTAKADGTFEFIGVPPGRYRLTASVPGSTPTTGWQLKSAIASTADFADLPIEIGTDSITGAVVTFTDRASEISGTIQDAAGRPAPEYWVIAFPADKSYWLPQSRRVQAKRPSADGAFTFQNLPAGEYLLGAVTDVEQNQWFDPAFLSQLAPASAKITLAEGEKKVQDLKMTGGHTH